MKIDYAVDLGHGGRWTSWRVGGREWLWQNAAVALSARHAARPGDAFVDAGGAEECCPTVRGLPDHGDAWARPWSGSDDDSGVRLPGIGTLGRRISADADGLLIGYAIDGPPGTPVLHAVHALLDLSLEARLELPGATTMIVLDQPDPLRRWPGGLDRFGADDGTAVCAIVPDTRRAVITDGAHRLELSWNCPARPEVCSLIVSRNLGGWPESGPYRSIGIEPMIGRAADLSTADPTECARLDDDGHLDWTLRLRAIDTSGQG